MPLGLCKRILFLGDREGEGGLGEGWLIFWLFFSSCILCVPVWMYCRFVVSNPRRIRKRLVNFYRNPFSFLILSSFLPPLSLSPFLPYLLQVTSLPFFGPPLFLSSRSSRPTPLKAEVQLTGGRPSGAFAKERRLPTRRTGLILSAPKLSLIKSRK